MKSNLPLLLSAVFLTFGSCASADTIYEQRTVAEPYYYGPPAAQVTRYYPQADRNCYYYDNRPSAVGLVDRTAKTGLGLPGKAAKEAFKAIF